MHILRTRMLAAVAVLVAVAVSNASAAVSWNGFGVGTTTQSSPSGLTPGISVSGSNVTFTAGSTSPDGGVTPGVDNWNAAGDQYGNKAYYSTHAFDGQTVGSILSVTYDYVSGGVGSGSGPFLNFAVTDGFDFAILLALPFGGDQGNQPIASNSYTVFEGSGALAALNGTTLPYAAVQNLTLVSGFAASSSFVAPIGGWAGNGAAGGLSLAWGNRGGAAGYFNPVTISNVTVNAVPEVSSILFGAVACCGSAGAYFLRRRREAVAQA